MTSSVFFCKLSIWKQINFKMENHIKWHLTYIFKSFKLHLKLKQKRKNIWWRIINIYETWYTEISKLLLKMKKPIKIVKTIIVGAGINKKHRFYRVGTWCSWTTKSMRNNLFSTIYDWWTLSMFNDILFNGKNAFAKRIIYS